MPSKPKISTKPKPKLSSLTSLGVLPPPLPVNVEKVLDPPYPSKSSKGELARIHTPLEEHFPKIREAREALKAKALDVLSKYMQNAEIAQQHGDYVIAKETYEYLLEHMPLDTDGEALLGPSVDKTKPEAKGNNLGPQINIGFQLGGVAAPKALPSPSIVDVTPKNSSGGKNV